jgi:hypothetical protein
LPFRTSEALELNADDVNLDEMIRGEVYGEG